MKSMKIRFWSELPEDGLHFVVALRKLISERGLSETVQIKIGKHAPHKHKSKVRVIGFFAGHRRPPPSRSDYLRHLSKLAEHSNGPCALIISGLDTEPDSCNNPSITSLLNVTLSDRLSLFTCRLRLSDYQLSQLLDHLLETIPSSP